MTEPTAAPQALETAAPLPPIDYSSSAPSPASPLWLQRVSTGAALMSLTMAVLAFQQFVLLLLYARLSWPILNRLTVRLDIEAVFWSAVAIWLTTPKPSHDPTAASDPSRRILRVLAAVAAVGRLFIPWRYTVGSLERWAFMAQLVVALAALTYLVVHLRTLAHECAQANLAYHVNIAVGGLIVLTAVSLLITVRQMQGRWSTTGQEVLILFTLAFTGDMSYVCLQLWRHLESAAAARMETMLLSNPQPVLDAEFVPQER